MFIRSHLICLALCLVLVLHIDLKENLVVDESFFNSHQLFDGTFIHVEGKLHICTQVEVKHHFQEVDIDRPIL